MSFTVLEFNIFQMPLSILVLAIIYQTLTGMVTISHEFETIAIGFILTDSIINQLWTDFIAKKPKKTKILPNKTINNKNIIASQKCQSSATTTTLSQGFTESMKA